jgi:hypothetical protein
VIAFLARPLGRLPALVAVALTALVAVLALGSLRWGLQHDLPILLYDGWLTFSAGRAPYREIFEMNPPGTFLVYGALDALTHGNDLALRFVDLACMIGLGALTMLALRRHGWPAGLIAADLFLQGYLKLGPPNALQREYLILPLLALSIYVALDSPGRHAVRDAFSLGMMGALTASVKPSLGLAWLVLAAGLAIRAAMAEGAEGARALTATRVGLSFVAGLAVVTGGFVALLATRGALPEFTRIAREYWPLYVQLDGLGQVSPLPHGIAGLATVLLATLGAIQHVPFTLAAGAGALVLAAVAREPRQRLEAVVLAGVLVAVAMHVPLGNKYWTYHYLPVRYVVALFAGIGFSRTLGDAGLRTGAVAVVPMLLVLCGLPNSGGRTHMMAGFAQPDASGVGGGDVDRIEQYLRANLRSGDRVLPLDVTGGAVHAMYRCHAALAGRFLYDFHFYHHVSTPIVRSLRSEVVATLENDPPRFVVQFPGVWHPTGNDCAADFPAFDSLLATRYEPRETAAHYRILERRGP